MKALLIALAVATSLTTPPMAAHAVDRHGGHETVRDREAGLGHHGPLGERQVERIVHGEGFVEIVELQRNRDRYDVEAVRPNGSVHRLAIDAHDGSVIRKERLGWARGPSAQDHARRTGLEFRFGF